MRKLRQSTNKQNTMVHRDSTTRTIKRGKGLGNARDREGAWLNFKLRAKERLTKGTSKLRPEGGEGTKAF